DSDPTHIIPGSHRKRGPRARRLHVPIERFSLEEQSAAYCLRRSHAGGSPVCSCRDRSTPARAAAATIVSRTAKESLLNSRECVLPPTSPMTSTWEKLLVPAFLVTPSERETAIVQSSCLMATSSASTRAMSLYGMCRVLPM